ncbi:MAG TPA: lamin tail domain-containing protein [Candidatus Eisenbacteria bacterium]|nr:lamin tail domain-containing protein [Candidatus Eisenbacteria bacterium]
MSRRLALFALLAVLIPTAAHAFNVTGRFMYQDRPFDGLGYTGAGVNLPIRHALVEIVAIPTQQVLGSGATDASGNYSIAVTGQTLPVSFYARCLTDGRPTYQIWVVDAPQRDLMGGWVPPNAPIHAIASDTVLAHPPASNHDFGTFLIEDLDGTGVAQAFNIFDCAVDYFDWLNQPGLLGRLPNEDEYVTYSWGPMNANEGSNYTVNTILLSSPGQGNDTDGWSDTVILHETGHWLDDVFSRSDNPGGAHFIGDNNANVLLAYGEGSATYHCAKVREWRAVTRGVDQLVSLYADLTIPPPVGTPGGLSFSYDFETGNFGDTGAPIGQRGSANETNVTSALWDLMDGPSTPDATPGVDDEIVEAGDDKAWAIEHTYMVQMPESNPLTVEDYYQGWFALNGPGFMQAGLNQVFVTLAKMPFAADTFEPDNTLSGAPLVTPLAHTLAAGHVVINEIELGAADAVELYNGGPTAVDLTGWQIEVYANGTTQDPTRLYTFAPRMLNAGETVTLHEGGLPIDNGPYHVYGGDRQVFNASWNAGVDGAVAVRNQLGTAVDFVRWRDANGVDNTTPAPAGAPWTGALDTPPAPQSMARDVNGTDTNGAGDFGGHSGSLGSSNHPAPQSHTLFGTGDRDLFKFVAQANTRYGFEARCPYSASDARIELLNAGGTVIGFNDNVDPSVRDARLEFYSPDAATYYLRVSHVGSNTDWAEYELLAFQRPQTVIALAPSGVAAVADNTTDTNDAVHLQWANASLYDEIHVYRDGTSIATLAGGVGQYTDHTNRGLHLYEIAGVQSGAETVRVSDYEFAGVLTCYTADDFEAGMADRWVRLESAPGSRWGVTPLAQAGAFGFTDSPAGTYRGAPLGGNENAIAELGQPANLKSGSRLEWDQICITEANFDYCIVEISTDDGTTWSELARYSEASDARWADHVAQPGDWRHESIDLSAFANQQAIIRFRLQSDANLEFDGWYVDNVALGDPSCLTVAVGDGPIPATLEFSAPAPNPVRGSARFAFALPERTEEVTLAIYDLTGRMVRAARLGPLEAGAHAWTWDGRDLNGRSAASGAYFARLMAGATHRTQKLLKLAP